MQILTALPSVRSPIVQRKGELRPSKLLSEPLRRLHATLQLDSARAREGTGPPRSILVVSADAGDGKSTVVAGLALIQREAGLRVAVVEADFRRPVMAKLLGVNSPHGLADVLAGTRRLDGALQQVERGSPVLAAAAAEAGAGGSGRRGHDGRVCRSRLALCPGGRDLGLQPAGSARASGDARAAALALRRVR